MNHYNELCIPPGWEYWFAVYGKSSRRTYNDNGTLVNYADNSPSTDILAKKLYAYLERTEEDTRPFFIYLSTQDPHKPATPPARYKDRFAEKRLPRPPSFNERDVSDKPEWVRHRELLGDGTISEMQQLYRKRLESLQAPALGYRAAPERVAQELLGGKFRLGAQGTRQLGNSHPDTHLREVCQRRAGTVQRYAGPLPAQEPT